MITREDPVRTSPENYKVVLENDRVRVIELTLRPGDTIPMHDHPDVVAYAITDVENVWGFPDGSEKDVVLKKGQAIWSEPFSHSAVNTGDVEEKILIVELKK